MKVRYVSHRDLVPGDTLVFLDKGFRITEIVPYTHPTGEGTLGIAYVEGQGPFMCLWDGEQARVAA